MTGVPRAEVIVFRCTQVLQSFFALPPLTAAPTISIVQGLLYGSVGLLHDNLMAGKSVPISCSDSPKIDFCINIRYQTVNRLHGISGCQRASASTCRGYDMSPLSGETT